MLKKTAITLSFAALLGSAVSAADNQLGILTGAMQGDTYYDLKLARPDMAGSIQLETFNGAVVGMMELRAGTNTNVRVPLMRPLTGRDLIAKLIVDGEVVDMGVVRVGR